MSPQPKGDGLTSKQDDKKRPVIDLTSPEPLPRLISKPTEVWEISDSSDDEPRILKKATTQHPFTPGFPAVKLSNTPPRAVSSAQRSSHGTNSSSRLNRHISQLENSTIKPPLTHTKSPFKSTIAVTPLAGGDDDDDDDDEEALNTVTPSRSSARQNSTMKYSHSVSNSVDGTNNTPKSSHTESYIKVVQPNSNTRVARKSGYPSRQEDEEEETVDSRTSSSTIKSFRPITDLVEDINGIRNPSFTAQAGFNNKDEESQTNGFLKDAGNSAPALDKETEMQKDDDDDEDIQSRGSKSPTGKTSQSTTINSSSPLWVRLKERRLRNPISEQETNDSSQQEDEDMLERAQITSSQLIEILRSFKQSMEESQALTTRWILHDTNQVSLDRSPPFTNAASPFASMDSFPLETDDSIESVSYWVNKAGKTGKTKVVVPAKHVESSGLPRVPKYTSHTILRRNVLTADDEKLRFLQHMPEFEYTADGDAKLKQFVKETQEMYNTVHFTSGREAEGAHQLREYLDSWLEELDIGCNQDTLRRYVLSADLDGAKSQIPHMKRRDKLKILESLGGPLKDRDAAIAKTFCNAFDKVFNTRSKLYDWSIKTLLLSDERSKDMLQSGAPKPSHISPKSSSAQRNQATRLETYADLTCMICGAIACQTHGDYTTQPAMQSSESSDDDDDDISEDEKWVQQHQLLVLTHKDMIRRHRKRISQGLAKDKEPTVRRSDPCSDDCFKIEDLSLDDYRWVENRLSEFLVALPEMLLSHTNPDNRSCHIAFAWDIPCLLVHDEIERYERNHELQPPPEFAPLSRSKRPDWYDNKRKTLKGDWTDVTKAHLHEKRTQANPCTHEGPCTYLCSCVEANILCESFCGCPDDCPRRFTGCACSSNGINCISETCICVQMNRECGPECLSCGAIPRIDPTNRYNDSLFATGCKNIGLQRGVSKKMLMGESEIPGAGFGLFTGAPIKKGDFLGEYGGEIISGTEAERRGLTYDRKISSFLFDLNSDWVVDAARIGNKTRFINHASTEKEGMNCVAKIVLVNGEHRIKFNATKDIDIGTELLFDYGPTFAEKHGLNKRPVQMLKNNATGFAKKGGGMKAKKSGAPRGGRGVGKTAKKTGSSSVLSPVDGGDEPPLVLPPDDDEDDDDFRGPPGEDEDEDSDNELEEKRAARRRRQIMRPARYTR